MQLFYKKKIVEINFILFKIKNPTRKNGILYFIEQANFTAKQSFSYSINY